ncbi:MAG: dihydrofolate reductase family protein [Rubrobacteraceae bacterium]
MLESEERDITRPFVTVSYAQTLDGRLATCTGSSQWISCPDSLCFAHTLRAKHDAVMVGVGTVCKDDPRLTVRHAEGQDPLRVVVDSSLRTPLDAAVLSESACEGTLLAVTEEVEEDRCEMARSLGATVLKLPAEPGKRVDLDALLEALQEKGVSSVMVEGGATLITSLLRGRLVDRLAVCVAPKILGSGIEAVGELGIQDLADAVRLTNVSFIPYGTDMVMDGRVEYPDVRDG